MVRFLVRQYGHTRHTGSNNILLLLQIFILYCLCQDSINFACAQSSQNPDPVNSIKSNNYIQEFNFNKPKQNSYKNQSNQANYNNLNPSYSHGIYENYQTGSNHKHMISSSLEAVLNDDLDKNIGASNQKVITKNIQENNESFEDLLNNNKLPSNELLKSGINHSDSLKPIQDYLQVGGIYNEELIETKLKSSTNDWFRIPNWLAGFWHRKYELILNRTDIPDTRTHQKFLSECYFGYGYQLDKNGDVWETKSLPSFNEINAHNDNLSETKSIMYYYQPDDYSNLNYTYKSQGIDITVNKLTNEIIKIQQYESINIINLIKPGVIRKISSVKWFTREGYPLFQDQRVSFSTLSKTFIPIDKAAFIQFLKNHHLENLIPN